MAKIGIESTFFAFADNCLAVGPARECGSLCTPIEVPEDIRDASVAGGEGWGQPKDELLRSLIYRPTIFQRNDIRWIAAHAWRTGAKARGIAALKQAKTNLDMRFIREQAAGPIAALIRALFGRGSADAVTSIPCGHSRRSDCFGKRLAQSVAEALELPFVQVFADRPCSGTSHPKESARLPPLRQIARPSRSMIVVDDLATSGQHLEEVVLAIRRLGAAASAIAWISGSLTGRTWSEIAVGRPVKLSSRIPRAEAAVAARDALPAQSWAF